MSDSRFARRRLMLAFDRGGLDDETAYWAGDLARALDGLGFGVEIALESADTVPGALREVDRDSFLGVVPLASGEGELDDEQYARAVHDVALARNITVLFAVGGDISDRLSKSRDLISILWAYPIHHLAASTELPSGFHGLIARVARGARRVVAPSEAVRSAYEALVPAAAGKTVLMPESSDLSPGSVRQMFSPLLLRPEPLHHPRWKKPKVILAGSDFKFASDVIEALEDSPEVNFGAIVFKSNWELDEGATLEALSSADVVVTEFCSPNAVWLSRHIRTDQRLIIHLHGYELRESYSADLDIDAVYRVVVPSEFYVEEAMRRRGWPGEKLMAIPNGVDTSDLRRPKLDGAQYHLGLVGYVPFLKRPDRALDVIETLLSHDDRYYLHVKGHVPWSYNWEWKKPPNQDAYREFFRRIRHSDALKEKVVFEGFSPDMGNWLRKIGWVLSPSVRETFHLAPMEGAASGAPPVVWERRGGAEIFSPEFTFKDTQAISRFILDHTDGESYRDVSAVSERLALTCDSGRVQDIWVALVREAASGAGRYTAPVLAGAPAQERLVCDRVLGYVHDGKWEEALKTLNDFISVTAQSDSVLKEVELTVRGVVELSRQRFSLFLPAVVSPASPDSGVPFVVKAAGAGSYVRDAFPSADLVLDRGASLVFSSEESWGDFQYDRPTFAVQPLDLCRFDRWLQYAASELAFEIPGGTSCIVAEGPWWVAATGALLAMRLNLPLRWLGLPEKELDAVRDARLGQWPTDPTNGVVDSILRAFPDCCAGGEREMQATEPTEARRPPGQETTGGLRIAYVGIADEASRLVQAQCGNVEFADLSAPLVSQLDPWTDLVVIGPSAPGAMASARGISIGQASSELASLADRSRAFGIPSTWLSLDEHERGPVSVLRKVDHLSMADAATMKYVLQQNPNSVESVQKLRSDGELLNVALRACGLPIGIEHSPVTSIVDTEVPAAEPNAGQLEPSDGVSVILPTHLGRDRILPTLDSLAQQSLPHDLIELIVVENGSRDGTEGLVLGWSKDNPGIDLEFLHLDDASVGAARNAGLERANRDYVTFLDDDDRLETNALYSWWLTAAEDVVVAGRLVDELPDGEIVDDTPTNDRVAALGHGFSLLRSRAGLLSLNGAKLLPRSRLTQIRYPSDLGSGEDVVFMSKLLRDRDLYFVAAAYMPDSAYVRTVRQGSVSRREESYEFNVSERLDVLRNLRDAYEDSGSRAADRGAFGMLAAGQVRLVRDFVARNPSAARRANRAIAGADLPPWMVGES